MDETDGVPDSTPPPPGSDSLVVKQAVADLAKRLGLEPAEIEVVDVEEVTWRDGSLGCARPDVMYTQALIDGSRITLRVGETAYEYHSGSSGAPGLCEKPTE